MFLTDLELSTDYKSVALPIELWGLAVYLSWNTNKSNIYLLIFFARHTIEAPTGKFMCLRKNFSDEKIL